MDSTSWRSTPRDSTPSRSIPRSTARHARNVSLDWVKRTPPGFEFSVKLYQKFTHPQLVADRSAITAADIDAFKSGIEPLAAADRLGPVLAQFPASFKESGEAQGYLEWLLETFRDYELAVELRHKSWSDRAEAVFDLLRKYRRRVDAD